MELKRTQNKIQRQTYLNKPNQPKTHAKASVAAAMEAWVECLPPPWEREWRFRPNLIESGLWWLVQGSDLP